MNFLLFISEQSCILMLLKYR